jgi:hypothetical protein
MSAPKLEDLIQMASNATGPRLTPESKIILGGVDPLGLRQINFDLMDKVFPGLNNVARHIRPFIIVTWAWGRARDIAQKEGTAKVLADDLRDFVDRVEVIYVWSQMLHPNAIDLDLPGQQVLSVLLGRDRYVFGGKEWVERRKSRRDSTSLMAAINYGPALKSMGWLAQNPENPNVFNATDIAEPALAAFQELIKDRLDHPAFSRFGEVEVTRDEVVSWSEAWRIDRLSPEERRIAARVLAGDAAPTNRRKAFDLMVAAKHGLGAAAKDEDAVRSAMIGAIGEFAPRPEQAETVEAWRCTQVRQLFRLALEAKFHWVVRRLITRSPQTTEALVGAFIDALPPEISSLSTGEWLDGEASADHAISVMKAIQEALQGAELRGLEQAILHGLALCIRQAPPQASSERSDRLPLARARQECLAWRPLPLTDFIRHVLTTWIFAQHVYWSVGRGLADARGNGKRLLRLRVVLDEGGWAPAPGVTWAAVPAPTADRLNSALSLAQECYLID